MIQRGEVFKARLPAARGHEQRGDRYVVALQETDLQLSTVIVAPTSTRTLPTMFRPEVEVAGRPTRLMLEQVRAVDRRRLGDAVARLRWDELERVDRALEVVLGLAR
jgi:mRNA interferase MazF